MERIKYRDHKGGFKESMKTTRYIRTIQDIKDHLNRFYNQFGKSVMEIKFEHIGVDKRNKWDTYYVLQRLKYQRNFTVAGMSNNRIN